MADCLNLIIMKAVHIKEPEYVALAGVIFCMYGIIFLAIQHWLSK